MRGAEAGRPELTGTSNRTLRSLAGREGEEKDHVWCREQEKERRHMKARARPLQVEDGIAGKCVWGVGLPPVCGPIATVFLPGLPTRDCS